MVKGNCDFISDFFFLAIVNLQYITILIKSELQHVHFQFQYRRLNCEIKRSQVCFLLFSVMKSSLHSNQRPCMLYFLLITASAIWGGGRHHPHPTHRKTISIKDPI